MTYTGSWLNYPACPSRTRSHFPRLQHHNPNPTQAVFAAITADLHSKGGVWYQDAKPRKIVTSLEIHHTSTARIFNLSFTRRRLACSVLVVSEQEFHSCFFSSICSNVPFVQLHTCCTGLNEFSPKSYPQIVGQLLNHSFANSIKADLPSNTSLVLHIPYLLAYVILRKVHPCLNTYAIASISNYLVR